MSVLLMVDRSQIDGGTGDTELSLVSHGLRDSRYYLQGALDRLGLRHFRNIIIVHSPFFVVSVTDVIELQSKLDKIEVFGPKLDEVIRLMMPVQ
jgi:hypothetical protein